MHQHILRQRKTAILALAAAMLPFTASGARAGTVVLNPAALPVVAAYGTGELTPLVLAADGKPLAALLRIPAGKVLPPHEAGSGTAILSVLSGTISWGDGDVVDESRERTYGPGSVLLLTGKHWAAARHGAVQAQVVRVPADASLGKAIAGKAGQAPANQALPKS